ncbi:hypothetical protein [Streptomyces sp. NPDC046939]|uniref:hypothetical protein n=1 Tax=Streptomyces sp. NPDC046939 TaxID=3155376 RepID=UPI0033ED6766
MYQSQLAGANEICTGWLMRSSDGGNTWSQVSGTHTVYTQGATDRTGWYWDGTGYRAKACVRDAGGHQACTPAF